MNNRDIFRILSPLSLFLAHLVYLIVWSPDPFLKKWIDGSFTFFIVLVLCNVIRARVVAQAGQVAHPDDADSDGSGPGSSGTS
jgi:hypothetical protein